MPEDKSGSKGALAQDSLTVAHIQQELLQEAFTVSHLAQKLGNNAQPQNQVQPQNQTTGTNNQAQQGGSGQKKG